MPNTHDAWKLCRAARCLAVSFKVNFSSTNRRFRSGLIRSHSSSGGARLRVTLATFILSRRVGERKQSRGSERGRLQPGPRDSVDGAI